MPAPISTKSPQLTPPVTSTSTASAPVAAKPPAPAQTPPRATGHSGVSTFESRPVNDAGDLRPGDVAPRQAAFRAEMQRATRTAPHDPPTEGEVRAYFRTLRNRPPAEAIAACERYQDAYQRHDGAHDYGSESITHVTAPERGTPRILSGAAEAEREHRAGRNTTGWRNDAPDNFAQANHTRDADGRAHMDCEGFAVSSTELLREAGFSQRQVVGTFADGSGHAAAILTRGGQSWVMSNGDSYRVTGRGEAATRAALDRAFDATVADGVPTTYSTGRTQDEASVRDNIHSSQGRID
jgi:hypothetical protein